MSTANNTIDINRDIGDFSYAVNHQRDAGVGLTEKTIDYIVDAAHHDGGSYGAEFEAFQKRVGVGVGALGGWRLRPDQAGDGEAGRGKNKR